MRYFCTYFDRNYLLRALVLYNSLRRTGVDFTLWALCFDDVSFDAVARLDRPGLVPVRLSDLESFDPEAAGARSSRSTIEYYFTLTPALPLYLLASHPDIDIISYLDADLRFYSSPDTVLKYLDGGSTLIIPHGFAPHLRDREKYGKYNVGMVSFRNDDRGRAVLANWRANCIQWCYDRVEDGRFADQRYLDDWPEVHDRVVVVDEPGIGLAPWNFMRFDIDVSTDPPTVDGRALVFYHFHGFKSVGNGLYSDGLDGYGRMERAVRSSLYGGYLRDLIEAGRSLTGNLSSVANTSRGSRSSLRDILSLLVRRRLLVDLGGRVLG